MAVGPFQGAPFRLLFDEGLGEAVARAQFHGAQHRFGLGFTQIVILQVAVPILVEQPTAFRARSFGDQDAGQGKPGGMVLDKFHVLERRTGAVGQRHPIAGLDGAIGGERKNFPAAAGGENDSFGGDGQDLSGGHFDGHHPLAAPLLHQQFGDEAFVVALDGFVLQGGLEKRVEHVEAGLVGGEPGALDLHAAERADGDATVGLPAPGAAPVLQSQHLDRGFVDEDFHRILIAQPVAARDGVVGVFIQAVVGFDDRGRPALSRDGVAAHGINLGNNSHPEVQVGLCDSNGGPQARRATAHHQHVTRRDVHSLS